MLTRIIKETLRIHSPVPDPFSRVSLEDHNIFDIKIKKGELVNVSFYSQMINPKNFENPLQFNPDRWINCKLDDPYLFIPFSAGSRNCIG